MLVRQKMKKGYIFLLDVVFAVMILTIGFMIISSSKPKDLSEIPIAIVTDNLLNMISSVKIKDLCNGCSCTKETISDLCSSGDILNKDQSLIDYIGEMHYQGVDELAMQGYYLDVIDGFYRADLYRTSISIEGDIIHSDPGKEKSPELISGKRVIFGYYEDELTGDVKFWGPYEVEMSVWK